MTKRRVGLVLLATVVAVALFLAGRATNVPSRVAPASPAEGLAIDEPAVPTAPTRNRAAVETGANATKIAPIPAASLPPLDAPLAEHWVALEARARAGDPAAACRLWRDLDLCGKKDVLASGVEFTVDRAARNPRDEAEVVAFLPSLEDDLARSKTVCTDLPDEALDRRFPALLRAAELGVPGAAATLAFHPPLALHEVALQVEEWAAFRDRAPGLLQRAAMAGDVLALDGMFGMASGAQGMAGGLRPIHSDRRRAAVFAMVLSRVVDPETTRRQYTPSIEHFRALATPDEIAGATAEAEALFAAHFATQTVHDLSGGWRPSLGAERCLPATR